LDKLNIGYLFKEPLSWIFENDCAYGVEYSSKGMKTSCKDLYLKVHRIQLLFFKMRVDAPRASLI